MLRGRFGFISYKSKIKRKGPRKATTLLSIISDTQINAFGYISALSRSSQPKCNYLHKNHEFKTKKQSAQRAEFVLGFDFFNGQILRIDKPG